MIICDTCGSDRFLILPVFKLTHDETSGDLNVEEWPLPREDMSPEFTRPRQFICAGCGDDMNGVLE